MALAPPSLRSIAGCGKSGALRILSASLAELRWRDLAEHGDGLLTVLLPEAPDAALADILGQLRADFQHRSYLALTLRRRPGDAARLRLLADMAQTARVPTVATGDVLYHAPQRRVLQDGLGIHGKSGPGAVERCPRHAAVEPHRVAMGEWQRAVPAGGRGYLAL
jgi:DNA polymerase III alpha subunit